jgi:hypothetical protein
LRKVRGVPSEYQTHSPSGDQQTAVAENLDGVTVIGTPPEDETVWMLVALA